MALFHTDRQTRASYSCLTPQRALSPIGCVTMGQSLNLSVLDFLICEMRIIIAPALLGLSR